GAPSPPHRSELQAETRRRRHCDSLSRDSGGLRQRTSAGSQYLLAQRAKAASMYDQRIAIYVVSASTDTARLGSSVTKSVQPVLFSVFARPRDASLSPRRSVSQLFGFWVVV